MATATQAPRTTIEPERRISFQCDWTTYRAIANAVADQHVRVYFDGSRVELMSPGEQHERYSELLDYIIKALGRARGEKILGFRSTRWLREDIAKGAEPDTAYYFGNVGRVAGKSKIILGVDPCPDLVVELDISHCDVNKEAIYGGIGVPEIWRFDGERLRILLLRPDGTYAPGDSLTFPGVPTEAIARMVIEDDRSDDYAFEDRARAWAVGLFRPDDEG